MSKVLVVTAHPYDKSFAAAEYHAVVRGLEKRGVEICNANLHADQFNPVVTEEEFKTRVSTDELVLKYQKMVAESDEIVLVYPVWWNSMPAMMKGFFDRVFLDGQKQGIKKATVYTTSSTPNLVMTFYLLNTAKKQVQKAVMGKLGIRSKYINFDRVSGKREFKYKKHLDKIEGKMSR